jgi:hypothetical protein
MIVIFICQFIQELRYDEKITKEIHSDYDTLFFNNSDITQTLKIYSKNFMIMILFEPYKTGQLVRLYHIKNTGLLEVVHHEDKKEIYLLSQIISIFTIEMLLPVCE